MIGGFACLEDASLQERQEQKFVFEFEFVFFALTGALIVMMCEYWSGGTNFVRLIFFCLSVYVFFFTFVCKDSLAQFAGRSHKIT